MNDNDRVLFGTALLEMKQSLDAAVSSAGGDPHIVCSLDRLGKMTAFEFMCHLATNNVRFEYKRSNPPSYGD